jgi:hypothetical protein
MHAADQYYRRLYGEERWATACSLVSDLGGWNNPAGVHNRELERECSLYALRDIWDGVSLRCVAPGDI